MRALLLFAMCLFASIVTSSASARDFGTVKLFNKTIYDGKGLGFITPEHGTRDLVFHSVDVRAEDFDELEHGCKVSFDVVLNYEGKATGATDVSIVSCPEY